MTREKNKIFFENREDAAEQMIQELPLNFCSLDNLIVLAVSEGGVLFADKLAKKMDSQMDILLSASIYSEVNPTLVIAKVGETEEVIIHKELTDAFGISTDYIYDEAHNVYEENILKYIEKYRDGKVLEQLNDKYVILTDECIETGLTMMTAVKTVISLGAKNIFIAVPILDKVVYESLVTVCDNIFCPYRIHDYVSIEYYYNNLEPFSFESINKIMKNR
jgi:putative phosphoribosyl transferase